MEIYKTEKGKIIEAFRKQGTHLFSIKFSTGGELPEELSGVFTSEWFANRAIEAYLQKTKKPIDA